MLHLYEEEGPDCVKRLNGMFAFAICDLRSDTPILFMARDHFGVKPFYYWHRDAGLHLLPRLKLCCEVPGIDAELDHGIASPVPDFSLGARSQNDVPQIF